MNRIISSPMPTVPSAKPVESHALLHEMIRSFTTLARTLNLSHAVKELGSTRQTLRRHIALLEEAKGVSLFEVRDRQYHLTDEGRRALPEAEGILARGNAWLSGKSSIINGLQLLHHVEEDGWCHFQHQKPIGRVFSSSGRMLSDVVRAWAEAGGDLEHEAFQKVRPYCTVNRRHEGNWLFTEVGDKSAYVTWFGWKVARSSIGRALAQMPGGDGFGRLVNHAYDEIESTQSMRLDHVFTLFPYGEDKVMTPVAYERLLLGARYPDNSFAMISAARRTYDVEIEGVTNKMLRMMPEDMVME
ncbi:MAG: LysR family transcriptional regulator [Roseobacter sp.]|nr:LysR family transcriptional regulator [Roseobacter sp.]